MKRIAMVVAVCVAAFGAAAQSDSWAGDQGCGGNRVRWNDAETFVEKETIDGSRLGSLKVSVDNAPVAVRGGNARGYAIEVCKAAASREALAKIRVWLDGSALRAEGPEGDRWTVFYAVHAPAGADVEVVTKNGPLSVRDFDGSAILRAANGPLSLSNVNGSVDAVTTNGPISIRGGSGQMKVRGSNGPLSIRLSGSSWTGGALDAETKNGPVTLELPRAYGSGVVVESSGRGPIRCHADGCGGVRDLDADGIGHRPEPRRVELGRGAQDVRIATVNGPLTITND